MATIDDVKALFLRILQRDASDADTAAFTFVINSGAQTIEQVLDALVNSAEADLNVYPVMRLYQAAFNRVPDLAGLDVHTDALRAGVSVLALAEAFAGSEEFTNRFGTAGVSDAFVEALYVNVLGRASDPAGKAAFLASGKSSGEILFDFAQSPEFVANSSGAIVTFLQKVGNGMIPPEFGPLPLDGSGVDAISGSAQADTITLETGADTVTDFTFGTGGDILDLSGAGNSALAGTLFASADTDGSIKVLATTSTGAVAITDNQVLAVSTATAADFDTGAEIATLFGAGKVFGAAANAAEHTLLIAAADTGKVFVYDIVDDDNAGNSITAADTITLIGIFDSVSAAELELAVTANFIA